MNFCLYSVGERKKMSPPSMVYSKSEQIRVDLRDTASLALDHCNKANIAIKRHMNFLVPGACTSYIFHCTVVY